MSTFMRLSPFNFLSHYFSFSLCLCLRQSRQASLCTWYTKWVYLRYESLVWPAPTLSFALPGTLGPSRYNKKFIFAFAYLKLERNWSSVTRLDTEKHYLERNSKHWTVNWTDAMEKINWTDGDGSRDKNQDKYYDEIQRWRELEIEIGSLWQGKRVIMREWERERDPRSDFIVLSNRGSRSCLSLSRTFDYLSLTDEEQN